MTSDHHLIVAESIASTYVTCAITNIAPITLPMPQDIGQAAATFALFTLGALLPDIDSEYSWLGRFLHLNVKHRTWTHSIWPVLALCAWAYFQPLVWALVAGYAIHLLSDMPSKMGICLFYPYPGFREYNSGARVKRGRHIWIYKTGSKREALLAATICIICITANIAMIAKSQNLI